MRSHSARKKAAPFGGKVGYSPLWRLTVLSALLVIALASSSAAPLPDSSDAHKPFSIQLQSGQSAPIFNGSAEISFAINNFGNSELSFRGISGLQLEPTSAFRHHSLDNIAKGDIFFVKCADSSIYEGTVRAMKPSEIEIDFRPMSAGERAGPIGTAGKTGGSARFRVLVGAVFPIGEFASTIYNDPKAGYANTGISIGAEYIMPLSPPWEIGALGLYSRSTINQTILMAQVIDQYPGAEIDGNGWDLVWFLPEAGVRTKLLPVMNLYIRAMAGVMGGYAPDITQTVGSIKKTLKSGSTFTYAYGAAVGITESDRIDLSLRFIGASGTYSKVQQANRFDTYSIQFMVGYIF